MKPPSLPRGTRGQPKTHISLKKPRPGRRLGRRPRPSRRRRPTGGRLGRGFRGGGPARAGRGGGGFRGGAAVAHLVSFLSPFLSCSSGAGRGGGAVASGGGRQNNKMISRFYSRIWSGGGQEVKRAQTTTVVNRPSRRSERAGGRGRFLHTTSSHLPPGHPAKVTTSLSSHAISSHPMPCPPHPPTRPALVPPRNAQRR